MWSANLHRIYAEEPPAKRAAEAIAFNAAVDSLGKGKQHRLSIKWWQALLSNWFTFSSTRFELAQETKSCNSVAAKKKLKCAGGI
jgi:hypothetical protein